MLNTSIKKSALRGWERERKDAPKGVKAQGEKDRGNLVFVGHLTYTGMSTRMFMFMERYKLGMPKLPTRSNNLLWNNCNSGFLGKKKLLNVGHHKAPEMHAQGLWPHQKLF